jgi:hypothetical protein
MKRFPVILLLLTGCVSHRTYVRDMATAYHAGQLNAARMSAAIAFTAKQGKAKPEDVINLELSRLGLYAQQDSRATALEDMIERQAVKQ